MVLNTKVLKTYTNTYSNIVALILQLRPTTSTRRTRTTWTRPTTTPQLCTTEGTVPPIPFSSSSSMWRWRSEFGHLLFFLLFFSFLIPSGRISPSITDKKPSRPSRTPRWRLARGTTCPTSTCWESISCTAAVSAGDVNRQALSVCVAVITLCLSVFCFRCLKGSKWRVFNRIQDWKKVKIMVTLPRKLNWLTLSKNLKKYIYILKKKNPCNEKLQSADILSLIFCCGASKPSLLLFSDSIKNI